LLFVIKGVLLIVLLIDQLVEWANKTLNKEDAEMAKIVHHIPTELLFYCNRYGSSWLTDTKHLEEDINLLLNYGCATKEVKRQAISKVPCVCGWVCSNTVFN
jgi:hypothetical protein